MRCRIGGRKGGKKEMIVKNNLCLHEVIKVDDSKTVDVMIVLGFIKGGMEQAKRTA